MHLVADKRHQHQLLPTAKSLISGGRTLHISSLRGSFLGLDIRVKFSRGSIPVVVLFRL